MQNSPLAGTDDYTRGFRRIVVALIGLVIVPTVLLLAVGLVMLIFYDLRANLVFGLLVVTLVACLITGAVLALVFLRREANLSRLQLDFVSKVSHELRTPLTSIRMFVETLRYEHDREKVETCLDVLQAETDRLSDRIERLLDWGRMEAGRRNYHRQPERIASVIDESVREFRAAIVGQQRELRMDIDDALPVLQADRAALVDALLNLLTNAHKYSPPDEPIEVRAWTDRREVHIAVRDHGVGIARHEHRRIFEKFYRSDERLSRSVEGSGLGLSIVQHAAHGHGGSVTLHSEPGEGSTFTLNLPLAEDAGALAVSSSAPPTSSPESIHVAEDSPDRG
ncbi:MAG: ATP-binding protein [Myxococcales bacterium]|jgi:two-component system phosphate regulon sensor histidine kinase PhoR